jgi:NADP-dependent 3-hydroxy acid dehydrogenase YdfG
MSKVWLITGSSTGFGRVLAEVLLEKGERVVATARNLESLADLQKQYPDSLKALTLDVTNFAQIDEVIKSSNDWANRIDVLVNNAGFGLVGAIEECSMDEIRHQFETNLFGAIAMIQAVLPTMRAQKSGHILNISSVVGLTSYMGTGFYSATKHALEAINESLGKEMETFGIKSIAINPGPFRTDFAGRSLRLSAKTIDAYDGPVHDRRTGIQEMDGTQVGDPYKAALAMIAVVEAENPPQNLPLGKMAYDVFHDKAKKLVEDTETWKDTILGADFDDAS